MHHKPETYAAGESAGVRPTRTIAQAVPSPAKRPPAGRNFVLPDPELPEDETEIVTDDEELPTDLKACFKLLEQASAHHYAQADGSRAKAQAAARLRRIGLQWHRLGHGMPVLY